MKISSDSLPAPPVANSEDSRALSPTRREMVEAGGRFWQMLGLPRSTGQIYGLLYLSTAPLALDNIVAQLGISKASASLGTRQLIAWGVIKQVWVPGERRDFFAVVPDLNRLLQCIYNDFVKKKMENARLRLDSFRDGLDREFARGNLSDTEHDIISERIKQLDKIQKKIQLALPWVDKLVG